LCQQHKEKDEKIYEPEAGGRLLCPGSVHIQFAKWLGTIKQKALLEPYPRADPVQQQILA